MPPLKLYDICFCYYFCAITITFRVSVGVCWIWSSNQTLNSRLHSMLLLRLSTTTSSQAPNLELWPSFLASQPSTPAQSTSLKTQKPCTPLHLHSTWRGTLTLCNFTFNWMCLQFVIKSWERERGRMRAIFNPPKNRFLFFILCRVVWPTTRRLFNHWWYTYHSLGSTLKGEMRQQMQHYHQVLWRLSKEGWRFLVSRRLSMQQAQGQF